MDPLVEETPVVEETPPVVVVEAPAPAYVTQGELAATVALLEERLGARLDEVASAVSHAAVEAEDAGFVAASAQETAEVALDVAVEAAETAVEAEQEAEAPAETGENPEGPEKREKPAKDPESGGGDGEAKGGGYGSARWRKGWG